MLEPMDETTGVSKRAFEEEAWSLGRGLFSEFLRQKGIDEGVLGEYDRFAVTCLATYGG